MIPNLNQHYFLTISAEIDDIIQPLKEFFGLTSFVYQKNFLDGAEIRLSNQPAWVRYFYQQQLYKNSVFEHTPDQYKKSRILWSSLPQHQFVLSKAREFNIDHGITFIEPQQDGCEFFFIGAKRDQPDALLYLNHLDLLEQFLKYFKEKAALLIKRADQNRIVIPDKLNSDSVLLGQTAIDRDSFLNRLNAGKLQRFSPREIDCIKYLLSGYTLKMIAQELNLSYRTVETHFEHIKQKANCHTKAELIRCLSQVLVF